jgi:hypothetical protein
VQDFYKRTYKRNASNIRGRFFYRFQNLTIAASKLAVNKINPINLKSINKVNTINWKLINKVNTINLKSIN